MRGWAHPKLASNGDMNSDAQTRTRLENRLVELEIKASYTEDTIDRLNEVVVRQQAQIDRLLRQVAALTQQGQLDDNPVPRLARDETPPHY